MSQETIRLSGVSPAISLFNTASLDIESGMFFLIYNIKLRIINDLKREELFLNLGIFRGV